MRTGAAVMRPPSGAGAHSRLASLGKLCDTRDARQRTIEKTEAHPYAWPAGRVFVGSEYGTARSGRQAS
jgi:hypothetical protein